MTQQPNRSLSQIGIAIAALALIVHWVWFAPSDGDTTTVILIIVIAVLAIFPNASSIKIFDAIEIKRDVQDLKKNVDERFEYVNKTISMVTSVLTASQTVNSNQNTVVNTHIDNHIDGLGRFIDALVSKYHLSPQSIEEQEKDLPQTTNQYDQVVSIFRLRFLVEEKIKGMARETGGENEQILETAKKLSRSNVINYELLRSTENIIHITDEIVRTGFQLRENIAEQIIESGKYVLAALDRAGSIQRRENAHWVPTNRPRPSNDDEQQGYDLTRQA